ncbi:type II toxin-antitoxin system RelE/ParE family toxin [uncultured Methylobacterium sp.]|jgi:phage-related protein|uniref:type II toxin-antitoxin system RelE/ParE family toxin n=1 Tax=uncultured Methylobacterium sp. TaxID=157278 RepID=UPI002613CB57|nr:type II toxin-antitoxin system RelE/ParE family toxin [uncultured Methylobacterium sp.]
MGGPIKTLQAAFYAMESGRRPVREWLMELPATDRKTIGEDIATLEFCWPIGKPKCAPISDVKGLYEVRSTISSGRIARVFFVLVGPRMVLLHGFIKKTQKTPEKEIDLATARMKDVLRHE